MLRTRLVWFTFGFASTAAVMSQFVYRDLLLDRHSLSCQLKQQFDSLESRLSNLESELPKDLKFKASPSLHHMSNNQILDPALGGQSWFILLVYPLSCM
ncbi:hypothetical protein Ccrd_013400 [Cynara cardunculus var. scolymus]|uniref:Uncharacterized protein n=1 Tax=Cynara cardunculus var. scolymus TaxID=59895 RepID=A0A103YFN5_CYNCS|nr:hypothetical protein Ccrd_013400 [Cynara cardunculus var. scolymus]